MLERRRSTYRRAFSSGIMLATFGILPLMLIELAFVLAFRRPQFDGALELAVFIGLLLAIPLGAAGLLGVVEGAVINTVAIVSERLAKQRLAQPRWGAWLYTIIAAPVVAAFVSEMFSGRRAKELPYVHFLALAVGVVGLLLLHLGARAVMAVRDWFRIRRWGKKQAVLLVFPLLMLAVGFYLADQMVLSRLYPALHIALALASIVCCQLAVATIYAGWRSESPLLGKLLDPGAAALLLIAIVAAGAFGLTRVSASENLRFVIYQHTAIQGKLVALTAKLGLLRLPPNPAVSTPAVAATLPAAESLRPGPRHPNVNLLLVTVDALRADHLGIYGYQRPTSPHIDAWARKGIVFERGYCTTPHTSFSITAIMTGRQIRGRGGGPKPRTVAAELRRYGYRTAGFFPPAVFFIDGDRFRAYRAARYDFEYSKLEFLDAAKRVDQVLAFLEEHPKDRPFFIWVHFFEPHEPYKPHAQHQFGARPVDLYDGEIAYVDGQFGRLLRSVMAKFPRTAVALTGDHGEAFGEHNSYYHGNTLYEEQVRVPAIISAPDVPPRRIAGAVETIDLTTTMISLADLPLPAEMTGTDLGPWLAGERAEKLPPVHVSLEQQQAVIVWPHKLLVDRQRGFRELYDLKVDPAERRNLVGVRKRQLARLVAAMDARDEVASGKTASSPAQDDDARWIRQARSGTTEQRRLAVLKLFERGTRQTLPLIKGLTKERDPGIAIAATVVAARWGDKEAAKRLPSLLARRDLPPRLRLLALAAQAESGQGAPYCPQLNQLLNAFVGHNERRTVVELMGRLKCRQSSAHLLPLLETVRLKRFAIEALGAMGARDAAPALIRVLEQSTFVSWQIAAARALGRLKVPSAARPLAETIARTHELNVMSACLHALLALNATTLLKSMRPIPPARWQCVDAASSRRCRRSLGQRELPKGGLLLLAVEAGGRVSVGSGEKVVRQVGRPREKSRQVVVAVELSAQQASAPLWIETLGEGAGALLWAGLRPHP